MIFHETAFGPEFGEGISPAVLLVTYGMDHNWDVPANGDLFSEADRIRAVLRRHESDWIRGTIGPYQKPMVANGATYVLYRYFGGDVSNIDSSDSPKSSHAFASLPAIFSNRDACKRITTTT